MRTQKSRWEEFDRHLKEQFINGLNVDGTIYEVLCELMLISDISRIFSEQGLA